MRVAIYARYSTDMQREASIDDQVRMCRERAAREGWTVVAVHSDAAMSATSMLRPGLQAMLRSAQAGEVDLVLAEALDRFSRDQEDIAALYKRLAFANVTMVTLSEGVISELHVGLSGTMAALFLKQLADKTRRGLRGRVEAGRSGGGLSYGYRIVPSMTDRGQLEIVPEQAAIVQRIFRDYVAGISPKAIAKQLNAEGVPGPRRAWSPSTIHGNPKRGTGILNNSLYVGQRMWNRQSYRKDPDSRRRISKANDPSAVITRDVPALRIIDDDMWQTAKERQAATRLKTAIGLVRARRPQYLFSGLTKCGVCGGGFNLSSRQEMRCFNNVARGTCTNTRKIARAEIERRVLTALQTKFLSDPVAFEAFCAGFVEETNRLNRERRAQLADMPREIAALDKRSKEILELLLAGFRDEAWKAELARGEARRRDLQALLASAEAPPPALHPNMSEVFRSKVVKLAAALTDSDEGALAREILRGFLDEVTIPADAGTPLLVKGNLGRMLEVAGGKGVAYVGCGGTQPAEFGVLLERRVAKRPSLRQMPPVTPGASACQDTSAPARSRRLPARSACYAPAPNAQVSWGSRQS
jgi:DNA invertase Pin-like site-specific DNA recombinase